MSTWLGALSLQPFISLDMLIVPCVEVRHIKYRVTRGRYCVVVYWYRFELVRLQKVKRLQWIKCQIWPLGSGIQGLVSEGALDALEETDQRSQSKWPWFHDYGGLENVRNVHILVPLRESVWR